MISNLFQKKIIRFFLSITIFFFSENSFAYVSHLDLNLIFKMYKVEKKSSFRRVKLSSFIYELTSCISKTSDVFNLEDLELKFSYNLGNILFMDKVFYVKIIKLKGGDPSFTKDNTYYKLTFYLKKKAVAHLHFIYHDKKSYFWGLIIHESYRGLGFSKPFLKFYFDMCLRSQWIISTTKQKKPLVNLLLQTFALSPKIKEAPVFISKDPLSDKVEVYSPIYFFDKKARLSQNLKINETNFQRSFEVFVNTEYDLLNINHLVLSLLRIESRNYFL